MTNAAENPYPQLQREQDAFNRQLDEMMVEHEGEFVLFKDGAPVEFFTLYEDAYRAGLERFGMNQVFLISEVKRREPTVASTAWAAGVMFQR